MTSLFIVSLMWLVGILLRIIHGSWLAPSAFYSLWWSGTTLLSILIGKNESLPIIGLFWILLSCILIGIGSLVFVPPKSELIKPNAINLNYIRSNNNFFKNLYYLSLFLSFNYIVCFVVYNEVSITNFKSLEGLLYLAAKFSKDRYEENLSIPIYIKLQLPFVFFSNALGGALYSISSKKKYIICLLPPVIIAILFTEKAGIFFCLSTWVASFLSMNVLFRKYVIFNFRSIIKLTVFSLLLVSLLILSAFARLGSLDSDEFEVVVEKLYSTLFGHIAAFSNWLSVYNLLDISVEGGKYTFSGVFDFLGFSKRESGLYVENYQLSNGAMTNLYSIHKGLLLDFSLIGSLIVYFIFGMVGSFFYLGTVSANKNYIGPLSIIYLITFVSVFYSIFIFNTTLLSCILTIMIFFKLKLGKSS